MSQEEQVVLQPPGVGVGFMSVTRKDKLLFVGDQMGLPWRDAEQSPDLVTVAWGVVELFPFSHPSWKPTQYT